MQSSVTERAILRRINRRLDRHPEEWHRVCKSRGRAVNDLGDYHRVDVHRNEVVDTHVQLEELGRELGVLGEREQVDAA